MTSIRFRMLWFRTPENFSTRGFEFCSTIDGSPYFYFDAAGKLSNREALIAWRDCWNRVAVRGSIRLLYKYKEVGEADTVKYFLCKADHFRVYKPSDELS